MEHIRVISDGHGTRVYLATGEQIKGVVRVDIQPITSGMEAVTVVLTILGAELNIAARIEHSTEMLEC